MQTWLRAAMVGGALGAVGCFGSGKVECDTCQIDISDRDGEGAVVTVDLTPSSATPGEVTVELKPPGAGWKAFGKITVGDEAPVTLTIPGESLPSFVQGARLKLADEEAKPIDLAVVQ